MANILIVDDEDFVRDLITQLLAFEGHEFHLAADGAQALEILRDKPVDLVVVDRLMPGMSGIEVLQMIRRNPKTAALKVLMCTGSSTTQEIQEALAAGADDYVLKSENFAHLAAKVARALAPASPT